MAQARGRQTIMGKAEDTATKQFFRAVDKFRKKNKISFANAVIQTREIEPDLYKAYCEELKRQRRG
jgi:hypothetical protein